MMNGLGHVFRSKALRTALQSATYLAAASVMATAGCSAGAPSDPPEGEASSRARETEALGPTSVDARRSRTPAETPDPTTMGTHRTTEGEYRFAASIDSEITRRKTELWAQVYRPVDMGDTPHPVVIFLHGNHSSCGTGQNPRIDDRNDYASSGTCPAGYVVAPSHRGYEYVAKQLASLGYVVVSINANRGIAGFDDGPDTGPNADKHLNLARGRLILRHLQLLSEWNTNGGSQAALGVDLRGKLDFAQVGLVGHSRGGEGVRAAYDLYREPRGQWPSKIADPVTFRGIFELAPVDGQTTSRTLNAEGTAWAVLLPMCDGDVSPLSGIRPFDRMMSKQIESPPSPKAVFTVFGANHNFYNTEWQRNDSAGCVGHTALSQQGNGSPAQRTTGVASIVAFFRAHLGAGANPIYGQLFNPLYALPKVVSDITRVERGYTDSPNADVTSIREDFNEAEGLSSEGVANDKSGVVLTYGSVPEHDPSLRAGRISWTAASENTYFQTNWSAAGQGDDISRYVTLDLRVSRQRSALNASDVTDFTIELVQADGRRGTGVPLSKYLDKLTGPAGGKYRDASGNVRTVYHSILRSVRIPLGDFGVDLTKVRGARLVFNGTRQGAIYVANIRLSTRGFARSAPVAVASRSVSSETLSLRTVPQLDVQNDADVDGATDSNLDGAQDAIARADSTGGNAIAHILGKRSTAPGDDGKEAVEIELRSDESFPIGDEFPTLRIGDRTFDRSYRPDDDMHRITFILANSDFAQLRDRNPVTVYYGHPDASRHWNFGLLDKRTLRR
ncbi:hypothetical protein LVJ94_24930 [Pendulispora rubella]|uniref:Uncharacterized protein n=1 Tax=Pendulispora rubella TaxID=2741070 RepID=A0ABZ2LI87_9BACT